MAETVIDFIRHGEPVGGRRFRGSGIDDPLSETGMAQMWRAIDGQCPWQSIVSSPMQRCIGFADALASRQGLPLRVDERLKEVGFGAWEGQSPADLQRNDPDGYRAFYTAPLDWQPQGAEPFADFVRRVAAA
jgi:broad specificity phosphatase PhoE